MLSGLAPRCLRVEPHPGPALALPPQGKYSVKDPRVALALCSPEVSASTAALLEGVFQTLGFESCRRQGASVQVSPHLPPLPQPLPSAPPGASLHSGWHSLLPQGFRGELTRFREQLDAHGGSVGCAFVALVARPWQLRQSQQLVRELSRCKALWGRPKVFLLLSSAPGGEWAGRAPGWGAEQSGGGVGRRAETLPPGPCAAASPPSCPRAWGLPRQPGRALRPPSSLVTAAAANGGEGPGGASREGYDGADVFSRGPEKPPRGRASRYWGGCDPG